MPSHSEVLNSLQKGLRAVLQQPNPLVVIEEQGWVESILESVVTLSGLQRVQYYEMVQFQDGSRGLVIDIDPQHIRALMLEQKNGVRVGTPVRRLRRLASVPVSEQLLGRMVDPLGNILDRGPELPAATFYPLEQDAPSMFERALVQEQLYTGIKVIDAMFPIGKGQRELILGDSATGKTSLTLDTILHQKDQDVVCVYVAIGQKKQAILDVYTLLKEHDALPYTVMVCASADVHEGAQFLAPYAGTAIAEYFLDRGQDVLIIYDDLTKHAFAYQTLSLLLKRPPGREAFPGDIFYAHSRLLERACNLKSGGSLTALPIVETQAGRLSSYIPTNLISITDGQLNLDLQLFNINQRPAIDIGRSVSRIGGKAQISAFREVAEHLRVDYAQFLEVEIFTRLGVQVMGETAQMLERGKRLREMLKQHKHHAFPWVDQVVMLYGLNAGFLDALPVGQVRRQAEAWLKRLRLEAPELLERLRKGKTLSDELKAELAPYMKAPEA